MGGLYLEGRFNGGFFALPVLGGEGLYLERFYTWRGLFSEFYGIYKILRLLREQNIVRF